jgi:hypothetical protein
MKSARQSIQTRSIFSKKMFNEDKLSYLSGNAGSVSDLFAGANENMPRAVRQEANTSPPISYRSTLLRDRKFSDNPSGPKGFEKMSDVTREEIQAQIAASEARGDTRVARLEGKIDTLTATIIGKLDAANEKMSADHEYNRTTRWVIVGLAIAIGGLMVGMATYGDAMFGRGMSVRDVVQTVLKENANQSTRDVSKPPK